eukprot:7471073-Pyramimonas_sp.AAC.1
MSTLRSTTVKQSVGGQRQASYIAATQSASCVRWGHLQIAVKQCQQPKLGRNGAVQGVVVQPAAQGRIRGSAATAPQRRGAAAAPH